VACLLLQSFFLHNSNEIRPTYAALAQPEDRAPNSECRRTPELSAQKQLASLRVDSWPRSLPHVALPPPAVAWSIY